MRVAEEQRINLIVIATFGKTGWLRLAFGSVTEKVVRLAPCPVLVIRGVEDRIRAGCRLGGLPQKCWIVSVEWDGGIEFSAHSLLNTLVETRRGEQEGAFL